MTRRLLTVHAHPDDESSKGAATTARYADEGVRVTLATCTGGEAGEVLNPSCDPVAPERMTEVRRLELEAAAAIIGFSDVHQLGYIDSGWTEDLATVPLGTFWHVPVEESGARLARIVRAERPHVVLTYPEDGGYPHPDHIRTHDVTIAALALAEDPAADLGEDAGAPWRVAKVYASSAFPSERLAGLHEAIVAAGLESPFERWLADRPERFQDELPPDARIRCERWFARRDAALTAHVTQIDPDGFWFKVPRDLEAEVYPYEAFTRLRSDVPTDGIEDDLFAGLDVATLDAAGGRVAEHDATG
ncbi:mycothiol conjugate amidase Mca [Nitriliruptor alkaliphilus]|uniref:mycothiol conjugate amidase Mca n=1 Tax=Nitriliruptor alkaliphilus TaxID=427918 RepID=UPI000A8FEF5E|nr:mycothiol conjugate amidase Mca [Nitriliruptor alkaliphilus]